MLSAAINFDQRPMRTDPSTSSEPALSLVLSLSKEGMARAGSVAFWTAAIVVRQSFSPYRPFPQFWEKGQGDEGSPIRYAVGYLS